MNNESRLNAPEEELSSSTGTFEIPLAVRLITSIVAGLLIIACGYYYFRYLGAAPETYASPRDLGLTSIFIFCLGLIAALWVPWERLGIRISKIGGIEFQQIVEEQASERAVDFARLESRIEELESAMGKDRGVGLEEGPQPLELEDLLLSFLGTYHKWAFSPSRIRAWGAAQPGFSNLGKFDLEDIKRCLRQLVADGYAVTRVSRRGNTLYRLP